MKFYYRFLLILAALLSAHYLVGQIQISEIADDGTVELVNSGGSTVDVSNYWLCNRPDYSRLSTLTLECGQLNLLAGESVTISGFNLSAAGDELGIYSSSNFGSATAITDYVIWGNRAGATRESVAAAAGLWTVGDRAPAIPSSQSLNRDLQASGLSAYSTGGSTICPMGGGGCGTGVCTVEGGTIALTTGGTSTVICVDGNPDPLNLSFSVPVSGASSGYIITDNSGNILGTPSAQPFDLDGAGVGTCLIYSVAYEPGFSGAQVGNNIANLTGCFDLSNGVTVYREEPDGGTVSLLDGSTNFAQCAGQIVFDVTHTTSANFLSYWYIITDNNSNILDWVNSANSNTIDLSAAPAGTCRVYGWSYRGLGDPIIGDPISSLTDDDCEEISSNFITVYREIPDGGTVSLLDGSTNFAQCAGQITFDVTHTTTAPFLSYWYIITDNNSNILDWVNSANSNTLDLSGAPAGTCRVYGWNYRGLGDPIVGNNISTLEDDFCEDISDNFITVYREIPDGGTVTLLDGSTNFAQCAGQITFDVTHTTTAPFLSYWYIITDNNSNILDWVNSANSNTIDLSGAPAGTCRVYGWNYRGLGDPIVGDNISTLEDDFCEDISDNFITVYREIPDGGTVSLLDGSTNFAQCAGQITFDVTHTTTAPFLSYWYIITDNNSNILDWVNSANSNTIDLSGAPSGTCRVYGWNYRGLGDPIVGDNISTLADDFCEDISDNFITVYREIPDGGAVSLLDGSTSFAQCAGQITFDVTHTTTAPFLSYWYIITDNNSNILDWVNSANSNTIDLSGAPTGTCRVYGWNYRGLGDPIVGDNISTLADDFCEDISDNFITVTREIPDGGTVTLLDGSTNFAQCAGQITFDVTHTTTAPTLSYWYIITDNNSNILDWVNSANSNTLDLSGAPAGTCRVYGWNYRGLGDPIVGDPISTLADDDCEDISDEFITVYREIPDGGTVALQDGGTNVIQCAGQVTFDVVHTTTAPFLSYWYIITDSESNILDWVNSANSSSLDLSGAPAGACRVYGWNYRGLGDPIVGDHISTLADDFCEDISDNFITVYREIPDGGEVSLVDGSTEFTQCAGQIIFDVTHTTSANFLSYWYIITDENSNILDWVNSANSNTIDLTGAPSGTCRIYGWNYRGLGDPVIGNNISTLNDDFCEDISSNFITVNREVPDGGTVTLLNGSTNFAQCAGQVTFDVTHTTTAPFLSYWYIITDSNSNILDFVNSANSNTLDLSGAPAGTCRVYGWNYRGLGDPIIGDNISTLADDLCEDISDNFITVYREIPDGGTVSLLDGSTNFAQCAGQITFDVTHTTTAPFLSYWYIITDSNSNILDWVNSANSSTLDLSGAPAGTCRVYGWNYRGLGDPILGDNISTLADDFCEDISDNFITVYREIPDGGRVALPGGSTIFVGDVQQEDVEVRHTTTAPFLSYWYIVTDDNDIILDWVNAANTDQVDLSNVFASSCRIYGWNYRGLSDPIRGESILTLTDDFCEDISDNFIEVRKEGDNGECNVNGGTISLANGTDRTAICIDGNPDPLDIVFSTPGSGAATGYIITDDNSNILARPATGPFDLEGAGVGTCLIYAVAYEPGFSGATVGNNISDITGCFDLSNPVTVYRQAPDGGRVTLDNGTTAYEGNVGDIVLNVEHTTTADFLSYWYILTNSNDVIIGYVNSAVTNTVDISNIPAGTCRIYGWSYRGLHNPIVGQSLTTLMDDDCEAISNNFISVTRNDSVVAGTATEFRAVLSGLQETTAALSSAVGEISAQLNGNVLTVSGSFSGLSSDFDVNVAGGAHIHKGVAGRNGGVELLLDTELAADSRAGSYSATANTFTLTSDQLTALQNRELYINIHTLGFPAGELRGQLLPLADSYFTTNLLGSNVIPSVNTQGAGNLIFEVNQNELTVSGSVGNLSGDLATSIAGGLLINVGLPGKTGNIEFSLDATLESDSKGAVVYAGNNTFTLTDTQYNNLLSEGLYVNVHTYEYPLGELRGQIKPIAAASFRADLSGVQEIPAVNTLARGRILVNYNGGSQITVSGSFKKLSSAINQSLAGGIHIHTAPAGRTGGVTFVLNPELSADLTAGTIRPEQNTFDVTPEQVEQLFGREMYVNIHSLTNVPGEIRGQLLPLAKNYLGTSLDGLNQSNSVATTGLGNVLFEITDNQLVVSGGFNNLIGDFDASIAGGSHVHIGAADMNGPISLLLAADLDAGLKGGYYSTDANRFEISEGLRDSLLSGLLYLNLHTTAYSSGELRGQILRENNRFPYQNAYITSPLADAQINLDPSLSDYFDVQFSETTDPDGDLVVYTYQLASDANFEQLVVQEKVGSETSVQFSFSTLDSLLNVAGPVTGNTYYQRVLASDGSVSVASPSLSLIINRADGVCNALASEIALDNGNTRTTICVDGNPDPLNVVSQSAGSGDVSGYIITDNQGNILARPDSGPFDLDGAGVGICRIYAFSYNAGITGAGVGSNLSNIQGCFDLSEPITVYRESPDGGLVSLENGATSFAQCAGQITFDVTHVNEAQFLSYWYIITDENNNVLGWVNSANSNTIDLSAAPAGTCRIWGWSYRGLDDPIVGQPISQLTDDDCEAISDNFITVYREVPDGGTVSLLDGNTTYAGVAGNIVFDVRHTTTAENISYWYIITDANNNILGWVNSANSNTIDLSAAPAGTCRVWGWNYRGLDDPIIGAPLSSLTDDFCEDISDNFIEVIRQAANCVVEGGNLMLNDGRTSLQVCAADGEADLLTITPSDDVVGDRTLVVTNSNDDIISLPTSYTIDVDGMSAGIYNIYVVAYNNISGLVVGNNLSDLSGCFDLSNAFVIDRLTCDPNCQMPINLRSNQINSTSFLINWDAVPGATIYELEVGFVDSSVRYVAQIENNSVIVSFSSNRVAVLRVRTKCGVNSYSPYSDVISLVKNGFRSREESAFVGETFGEFQISEPQLSVFPNPVSQFLNVELENGIESTLRIFDSAGREMYETQIQSGSTSQNISVGQYPQGLYQLIISANGQLIKKDRFIKMN